MTQLMKDMNFLAMQQKFLNPDVTANGDQRASVPLMKATTLWFNTGTLCNIECVNCYIESSPKNDSLVYITPDEVSDYLDQIDQREWATNEIAFTGGEPFLNPDMIEITRRCLDRNYKVLILTNAMLPMMRKSVQNGLLDLRLEYNERLTLRVSLDHYTAKFHDTERGKGSYNITLNGMKWLRDNGFKMAIAGRTVWGDSDIDSRLGYAKLFNDNKFEIDANDPNVTVLFPEIDEKIDVPEITTECWGILNKSPKDVMCASSRMVVKRKGAKKPSVVACTLLPYSKEFEMGNSLEEAEVSVKLNHPHCAKFCVLGGASCSS